MRIIRALATAAISAAVVLEAVAAGAVPASQSRPASRPRLAAARARALPPITADDHGRLRDLRRRLCLNNDTLAAVGCDREAARSVLRELLFWYADRKGKLKAARGTVFAAREEMATLMTGAHAGPRDPAAQQRLQEAIANHKQYAAAEDALIETAAQPVGACLTAAQREVWAVVRTNTTQPARTGNAAPSNALPSCYAVAPGLTEEQRIALRRALQTRELQLAGARTADGRAAAEEEFNKTERTILTVAQQKAIEAADANAARFAEPVLRAEQEVLPVPRELRGTGSLDRPDPPSMRPAGPHTGPLGMPFVDDLTGEGAKDVLEGPSGGEIIRTGADGPAPTLAKPDGAAGPRAGQAPRVVLRKFVPEVGAAFLAARVRLPAGTTAGYAGLVFGYKSESNYWMLVLDRSGLEKLCHVEAGVPTLKASRDRGPIKTGVDYLVQTSSRSRGLDIMDYDFGPEGSPCGRVGLASSPMTGAAPGAPVFRAFAMAVPGYVPDMLFQWSNGHQGTTVFSGRMAIEKDSVDVVPTYLKTARVKPFQATFRLTRPAGTAASDVRFVFNIKNQCDYNSVRIVHGAAAGSPAAYRATAGGPEQFVAPIPGAAAARMPACPQAGDPLWVRVQYNKGKLTVACDRDEAFTASRGLPCAAWDGADFDDMSGGCVGFAGNAMNIHSFVLKTPAGPGGVWSSQYETTFQLGGRGNHTQAIIRRGP